MRPSWTGGGGGVAGWRSCCCCCCCTEAILAVMWLHSHSVGRWRMISKLHASVLLTVAIRDHRRQRLLPYLWFGKYKVTGRRTTSLCCNWWMQRKTPDAMFLIQAHPTARRAAVALGSTLFFSPTTLPKWKMHAPKLPGALHRLL